MACRKSKVNVQFNQDMSFFIGCTDSGVRIYSTDPLVELQYLPDSVVGSVSQAQMIEKSNIIGIVAGGSRSKFPDNKLIIFCCKKNKLILGIEFCSPIRAFRMRRDLIVVALYNVIEVLSFPEPIKKLFSLRAPGNLRNLLEMSPSVNCKEQVIIFPGQQVGSLQIFDIMNKPTSHSPPVVIQAHQNDLTCIAIDVQGTKIATASAQGTLIRIWETATKNKVLELRRGSDSATIYSIRFSLKTEYLTCFSDKGSVHIFAIKDVNLNKRLPISSILGKYMESMWSFTNFALPPEEACIVGFSDEKSVVALGLNGSYHKYNFSDNGSCSRKALNTFESR